MSKYTFKDFAQEVLRKVGYPLDFMEIWEQGKNLGLDKKLDSYGKTPWDTLGARIYTDIKNLDSKFYITQTRPTKFFLKELSGNISSDVAKQDLQKLANNEKKIEFKERDLHPLLAKFLYESKDFNLFSKTIFHEKSSKAKSGENEWLHPDVVGIYFSFNDFKPSTHKFLQHLSKPQYKLYSFEIKRELNFSNLRESYFQAVSNSSFANEGYLVAFYIDEEILEEVKRLNNAFGIGLIELSAYDSRVLIPSVIKQNIDVKTLDLLVEKNEDFRNFIDDINTDIAVNDLSRIAKNCYDEILQDEKYDEYLKDKKIPLE